MHYLYGPFHLDSVKRMLERDGERISLPGKALDMLLALIENRGVSFKKEELISKVWGAGIIVTDNNFNVTLRNVRKALGESGRTPQYIVTTSEGYSFIENVKEVQDEEFNLIEQQAKVENTARTRAIESVNAQLKKPFGGYGFHVLSTCFVYASFYSLALLTEIAYKFDQYGRTALKITPMVFCWIFFSSIGGLMLSWKWTIREKESALAFSGLIFIGAALVLYILLCLFLPTYPITEANFQTHTAQAAYLKDICYFLFLAMFFLVPQFHFVMAMLRELQSGNGSSVLGLLTGDKLSMAPKSTIYLRPWILGCILILAAAYFLIGRARLLDNLLPSPYMNLFQHLIQIRLFLYLGLAIQCLAWYARVLTGLKRTAKEMTIKIKPE